LSEPLRLNDVPEIVNIYCATANPTEVIFVETEQRRAILGVVDGFRSKGVEAETDIEDRKQFLRKIGSILCATIYLEDASFRHI